jgi:hypothetical protein
MSLQTSIELGEKSMCNISGYLIWGYSVILDTCDNRNQVEGWGTNKGFLNLMDLTKGLWRLHTPLVHSQTQHCNSALHSSTVVYCVQSLYINRWPPMRSSCSQAGLVFRPAGLFTIAARAAENPPRNSFFLPRRKIFTRPGPALLRSLHKGGTCSASGNHLRGSTSDLVRSSSEASVRGGALWRLPTPLVS